MQKKCYKQDFLKGLKKARIPLEISTCKKRKLEKDVNGKLFKMEDKKFVAEVNHSQSRQLKYLSEKLLHSENKVNVRTKEDNRSRVSGDSIRPGDSINAEINKKNVQ